MLERKTILSLNNYEVSPPEELWNSIASQLDEHAINNEQFAMLAETEVALAVFEHEAIWQNIVHQLDAPESKPAPVFQLKRKFIWLAAAAVVGIALFLSITFNTNQTDSPAFVDNGNKSPHLNQDVPSAIDSSILDSIKNNQHLAQNNKFNLKEDSKAPEVFIPKKAQIDLSHFDIENEDNFFLILANYIVPESNDYGQIEVKLDNYSTISVSPRMAMFMKGLYEKKGRRKQRPTRLARRSYKKLRSWKKSTEQTFITENRNLADPFELASFLNKKS
ncbi:hypothetical protein [Polluticaenibacter yanchengensis]|uniref:Uncharacterized protein n=1 Tax=Polluticaenibacter yanchengensis TaxID=3014562 RepID=A0ABT4UGW1_9BACT|nr:hypothetical protein [Chitinophagaceae bacterium LY-5]